MLFWAVDNSAPANYLLISGDRDFANALHQLRLRRYNILLAHPTRNVSPSLFGAAKNIWLWTSLAMGGQEITIQDTKQLDRTSNSIPLTNGATKGSLESMKFSGRNLKDSFSQDFDYKNSSVSFTEFDQVRGRLYAKNGGVEQKISNAVSANGNNHWGYKLYSSETNLQTVTSSRAPDLASGCDARISLPSNSNLSQTYADSRQNSSNDIKQNVPNSGIISNSSADLNSVPSWTSFVAGANVLPTNARAPGCKMRPSFPLQAGPSCPQGTPNFYKESHVQMRPTFPADLRADMPDFDQVSDMSNFQRSPNIQPGLHSPQQQFSKPFPSDQVNQCIGNIKSTSLAQTEPFVDAVAVSASRLSLSHHSESDISHRVQMRIIMRAMETLKMNMMVPIEQNLEDCIRYGDMHIPSFNLRESLDKAVELKNLAVLSTGGGFKVYLPCDTILWQCVDPLNVHDVYPKEIWDELHKFLLSHEGCKAMTASQNRYDAAQLLKNSCLKTLLLGQIIHVLQLAINVRRWLRPHHLGWCPLSITIPDTRQKPKRPKAGTHRGGRIIEVKKA